MHGVTLVDNYRYLEDLQHPDAQAYRQAERSYLADQTRAWEPLRREIERELNQLLPATTRTHPVIQAGYEYFREIPRGGQYPVFYRKKAHSTESPAVLLDLNQLAGDSEYYALGGFALSPDGSRIAYTEDRTATQSFRLMLKSLAGTDPAVELAQATAADIAWHPGGTAVLYLDAERLALYRQSPMAQSAVELYREQDPSFSLSLESAGQDDFVLLKSESHAAIEVHLIDEAGVLHPVSPRRNGHRYQVRVSDHRLLMLSNQRHPDYEIVLTELPLVPDTQWRFLASPLPGQILDADLVNDYILLQTRQRMIDRLYLWHPGSGAVQIVAEAGPGETLRLFGRPDQGAAAFRYVLSGMLKPDQLFRYSVEARRAERIASDPSPPDYDQNDYQVARHWVTARDGVQVPITLVYRQGAWAQRAPVYLAAYGAYGLSLDLRFDPTHLPLLNRDIVLAFAHVRGGGALGSQWHEQGRGINKLRSITDLIDVAQHLTDAASGQPRTVIVRGRSAGGMVVGAALNMAPGTFAGAVVDVPFVDPLNTLLDDTQRLTPADRLEWGDPREPEAFHRLHALSPYEQVSAQNYPAILVTAGARDARVRSTEALRWMAKLRQFHAGPQWLFIDIKSNSGHLGATDQYQQRRARSLEYAFLLKTLEKEKTGWNYTSR